MAKTNNRVDLMSDHLGRRDFLKRAGIAGAGVAALTLLGEALGEIRAQAAPALDATDVDIVNFALNLEYLEAEFYSVAMTGKTITQLGIIPPTFHTGLTTGGKRVFDRSRLSGEHLTLSVAEEIAFDEQQHVKFLVGFLGSAAVKKPAINLNALGIGFGSVEEFLILARALEDVGVSAYGGAAPLISSKTILSAAVRIALTEALHAGNVRLQVIERHIVVPPVDAKDIPPVVGKFFAVDGNALAVVRTTSEVLHIVYAGGTSSGGFFPEGMNGTIRSA